MQIITFGNDDFLNTDKLIRWWLDGYDVYLQLQDMAVPTMIRYATKEKAMEIMGKLNQVLVEHDLFQNGTWSEDMMPIFDMSPVDFTPIAKPVKISN